MKRITYILAVLFACTSCSSGFLDNAPKGKYHEGNYDMSTGQELLVLATLMDGYNIFAQQTWPVTACTAIPRTTLIPEDRQETAE